MMANILLVSPGFDFQVPVATSNRCILWWSCRSTKATSVPSFEIAIASIPLDPLGNLNLCFFLHNLHPKGTQLVLSQPDQLLQIIGLMK
jgi:hypothetical protein